MPIPNGSTTQIDSTGTSTVTVSHTVAGSDRLLRVGVTWIQGQSLDSYTYDGVAMTKVIETRDNVDTGLTSAILLLIAPNTGTHDVVLTFSGNVSVAGGIQTYTGVHQTTAWGTGVGTFGQRTEGTPINVSVSSAADELVVDVLSWAFAGTASSSAGQTDEWNFVGATSTMRTAGSHKDGASSTTMEWTPAGSNPVMVLNAIPLKPAAAAAGQPTMRRWGGVPFVGGQGIGQKGSASISGKQWGRRRSGIIVPSRFREAA